MAVLTLTEHLLNAFYTYLTHLLVTTNLYGSHNFTLCFHIQALKNWQGAICPGQSGFRPMSTATKLYWPGGVKG